MTSDIKKLPKSEIEVLISLPWEEWKTFIDQAVEELSKEIKVEGFRPGKAPRHLVESKIGSGAILETAADKAVRKSYVDFLQKEKVESIGRPEIEITKIAEGNELEYKVKTAVMPEINLKPWQDAIKKVNAKEAKKEETDVTEDEITKELDNLAGMRAELSEVDREAKDGDNVLIDFQVLKEGVPIENGTSKNHPLVLGRGVFIPGFEEQVIGMKKNEEKEFELKFPEDYHAKHLAGAPATFKVKVNVVQEKKNPEINDEFAKSIGKFESLEDLKKNIVEGLAQEKKAAQKEKRRGEIIEKLIEQCEVELPEVLIHEELHKMLHEFENQLQMMQMTLDAYLEQTKKKREELEKEWAPQAEKRIKSALALEQIAKDQAIDVDSRDIEAEMNKTLQQYKKVKDVEKNIDLERLYNYVKGVLTNEKVFEYLEKL